MNSLKNLYQYLVLSYKTLYLFDKVSILMIYERILIIGLIGFLSIYVIFQGSVDFKLFSKLFLLLIGLHSYQGIHIIFDDYVQNKFVNSLFKNLFLIICLVFLLI